MNLPFFIARRYLFSKKSHNIINIISFISTFTVTVVTAAMVIVVSAFDGLEKTITDLYNSFDADIVVYASTGKTFAPDNTFTAKLDQSGLVEHMAYSLEESVFLRYGEKQTIATIKGVSSNYQQISGIDTLIVRGHYNLGTDTISSVVLGYSIAVRLGIALNNVFTPLNIYSVKRDVKATVNAADAVSSRVSTVSGLFSVQNQPEYDDKYVIAPLWLAQELLGKEGAISTAEIKLKPGIDVTSAKDDIQVLLGSAYTVKNRYQLHEVLYKVINSEKWAVFMILSLIMLIAIFNIMGSLTMLIVEKHNDAQTLKALGGDSAMLHSIFRTEAFLITLIGTFSGAAIGIILCLVQINFHFILMAGEGSLPYPILIKPLDVAAIFLIVLSVGALVGWLTTRRSIS